MPLKEKIFGAFDFGCLDDPEFKEDAVREEVIAPLLRHIGFSASGVNRIVRSRALTHPYVMFGSQTRKINIIPDYLIEVNGDPCFVLDAKAPTQEIVSGENVAQVYSYAIHPEVRAWNYGLCNGKSLALFELTAVIPKHVYDLTNLDDVTILDINQKLNPRTIKNNAILDYRLDGGTYLSVMGIPETTELYFPDVPLVHLGIVSEGHYSASVICKDLATRELAFTFDFDREQFDSLLIAVPEPESSRIRSSVASHPFSYQNNQNPPHVTIRCKLTAVPQFSTAGEMFFPMQVLSFHRQDEPIQS